MQIDISIERNLENKSKLTSEGRLEAEVDVLLAVEPDDEAGHVHHLKRRLFRPFQSGKQGKVTSQLKGDTVSISVLKTLAVGDSQLILIQDIGRRHRISRSS